MKSLHDLRIRVRRAGLTVFAALAAAVAGASQWDLSAGDYHSHLIASDTNFELHLHDQATHGIVDTSRGKVTATLLAGGARQEIPMRHKQAGILVGDRALKGDWTLLFRVEVPGRKPAQLRYSSRMPRSGADAGKERDQGHDGHDHDHDDDHGNTAK